MINGWIKLDRKLLDWEWFNSPNTLSVWIYLLLSANIEPCSYKGVLIPRGSCHTTLKEISAKTGLSIKEVRNALNRLERAQQTAKQKRRDFSIISILNYEEYQKKGKTTGNERESKRGTPSYSKKNYKENKNGVTNTVYTDSHTTERGLPIIEWHTEE